MILKKTKKIYPIGRSQGILLPKIWLDYRGLKVGDIVELVEDDDGNLVIKPMK